MIQLLRAKPPARRLEEAVSASNRVAEQCKQAMGNLSGLVEALEPVAKLFEAMKILGDQADFE